MPKRPAPSEHVFGMPTTTTTTTGTYLFSHTPLTRSQVTDSEEEEVGKSAASQSMF